MAKVKAVVSVVLDVPDGQEPNERARDFVDALNRTLLVGAEAVLERAEDVPDEP